MSGRLKRVAVLVAAFTLCLVITAGLASASPFSALAPQATRELNIYGFGPGDDVANGRAAYAADQLGNNVRIDNPRGGFNDQAFLAMLASRNAPDVVYMGRRLIGTYAAKKALVPLSGCIRNQRIDTKQYRAAALREVTYAGKIYALPEFTNQITIIVDDDIARESGVNIASISTKNWKQLRQINKKMLKIENGRLTRIGFDPKIPEFFPLWVKWFGKDLISKDGKRVFLNSKEAVAALAYTMSLINDHGGYDKFKAFRDTFDFFGRQNPLVRDQMGAWPMESFIYNVFANNSPNTELTAKYFVNRKGGPITMFAGSGWAIPRGSKDPDLACRWMKAMTSVDAWKRVASNRYEARRRVGQAFTGLYTANARADIKIFEDVYQKMGKRQFDEAVQLLYNAPRYGFALSPSPASAEINQAMIDAINRVLTGKQSPRQALNQAQKEATAAIKKNS